MIIRLDVMLAKRKMSSLELAEQIGLTPVMLSRIKTGKIKALRLSTLEAICEVLDCGPGDILEYKREEKAAEDNTQENDEAPKPSILS